MSVKFSLLCISVFTFIYLLTIIIPKYVIKYFDIIQEILFKNLKEGEEKEKNHSINKNYSLLLIFLLIFKSFTLYFESSSSLNNPVLVGRNNLLYKIGIAIFFFLLGLLLANGKKIIKSIMNHPIYVLKTITLTMTTAHLLNISKYCIKELLIMIASINLIYLLNYYQTFKRKKESMQPREFIYHFLWLQTINFINSFLLIFNILNI